MQQTTADANATHELPNDPPEAIANAGQENAAGGDVPAPQPELSLAQRVDKDIAEEPVRVAALVRRRPGEIGVPRAEVLDSRGEEAMIFALTGTKFEYLLDESHGIYAGGLVTGFRELHTTQGEVHELWSLLKFHFYVGRVGPTPHGEAYVLFPEEKGSSASGGAAAASGTICQWSCWLCQRSCAR